MSKYLGETMSLGNPAYHFTSNEDTFHEHQMNVRDQNSKNEINKLGLTLAIYLKRKIKLCSFFKHSDWLRPIFNQ